MKKEKSSFRNVLSLCGAANPAKFDCGGCVGAGCGNARRNGRQPYCKGPWNIKHLSLIHAIHFAERANMTHATRNSTTTWQTKQPYISHGCGALSNYNASAEESNKCIANAHDRSGLLYYFCLSPSSDFPSQPKVKSNFPPSGSNLLIVFARTACRDGLLRKRIYATRSGHAFHPKHEIAQI